MLEIKFMKTKIVKRKPFTKNLIIIDGKARSAKALFAPIISSFNNCEMWKNSELFESFYYLDALKMVEKELLKELLVREIDKSFYYSLLGRNVNFRYGDISSIWKYKNPKEYVKRIFSKREYEVFNNIKKNKQNFIIFSHDLMANPKILFETYPKVKVLWSRRHPVYVCDSWRRKNWGNRFGKDNRSLFLAFKKFTKGPVPWYFVGKKEKEYINANPVERIIMSYDVLQKLEKKNYIKFKNKYHISQFFFEDVVTDKKKFLSNIKTKLKLKKSIYTDKILKRERVPRKLFYEEFENKLKKLSQNLRPEYLKILKKIINNYENDFFKITKKKFNNLFN